MEETPAHRHRHRHTDDRNQRRHRNSKKNQETGHRHRHHHQQNGLENNEIAYGFQYRYGDDHGEPVITERLLHDLDGDDYGRDVHGQEYLYERYELPKPVMPHMPTARVPFRQERPPHPLGGHYSNEQLDEGQERTHYLAEHSRTTYEQPEHFARYETLYSND